jgi:CPA2 family monovalent cation:H+ antiporter-2
MDAHAFLLALATVLGVAAVTTVVFQRLHQPVVLGYILAGFIIGPNVPIPLVADREIVRTLSELGVILLMFSLGLELSLGKLLKLGPRAGLTALLESSLMVWLGFVTGQLLGWTPIESLFAGAIIAISSTTIIAKAFDGQRVAGPVRELVVGVLVFEDLIAIVLMATLTAIASGSGLSAFAMAKTIGRLAVFLVVLVSIGLLLVPRAVRAINRLNRPETTLVASIGFCFGISLLAHRFGYSVALGAFIAGSLIAESGEAKPIEHLVQPVRDMFAAIFFVSVGVLIDPAVIAQHWLAITLLTSVVLVGKVVGVSLGAFLTGNGVRTSVQSGMSLAQIGEFSFIIAGLGLSLNATGGFLYPVAVTVSAITTLTTPWLIKASDPVANFVDRKMPHRLQTFLALYGSWVETLQSGPKEATRGSAIRRLVRLLLLDVGLLAALAIATSVGLRSMASFADYRRCFRLGIPPVPRRGASSSRARSQHCRSRIPEARGRFGSRSDSATRIARYVAAGNRAPTRAPAAGADTAYSRRHLRAPDLRAAAPQPRHRLLARRHGATRACPGGGARHHRGPGFAGSSGWYPLVERGSQDP